MWVGCSESKRTTTPSFAVATPRTAKRNELGGAQDTTVSAQCDDLGYVISRLYASYQMQLRDILCRLGLRSVQELRGRMDLLNYRGEEGGHHGAGAIH